MGKRRIWADMGTYFFSVKHMAVGYSGTPVVKDVEIGLEQGEILALIGPNGAGKSTILKSISGQLALLAGTVWLEGCRLDGIPEEARAKKLSVLLTERIHPEMMTCADVAAMGRYPYTGRLGILSERDKEKVREALELVHIQELAEREFLTLSDGQQQRVMLARAIAQEPEILVLDEPTSFLDIRHKLDFLRVLRELAGHRKLTVLLSLHELDYAERIADRVLCIKDGYVDRFGPAGEVFTAEYISSFYGVRAEELRELGSWRMR